MNADEQKDAKETKDVASRQGATEPRNHIFTFMHQFFIPLVAGEKLTTFRLPRRRMPAVGDVMDQRWWTGTPYRSPMAKIQRVPIRKIERVTIHLSLCLEIACVRSADGRVLADGDALHRFAVRDGFRLGWKELVRFFQAQGHPAVVEGDLYSWDAADVPGHQAYQQEADYLKSMRSNAAQTGSDGPRLVSFGGVS